MQKNSRALYFVFAIVIAAFLGLFTFNQNFSQSADKKTVWITIDERELAHIKPIAAAKGSDFRFEVKSVQNGIAVIEIDDSQLSNLSFYMHDEFHKCGGFTAHETLSDAEQTVADNLTADSTTNFVAYSIDNQTNVTPLLDEAQELNVRQTIIDLSAFPNRRYNQPSGTESANWIKNKWAALVQGRNDITVEFFTHPTTTSPQPSVILTIQGTSNPSEVVILGAHQDSINLNGSTLPAPGADDDASGVASLTEAIRVLVAKNFRPHKTVKFMAFAAEEVGLRGSGEIATDFKNRNVNVIGAMQLDMTNFKGTTGFDVVMITDFTNAAQNQFISNLLTTYQPSILVGNSTCGYGCSDHASWNSKGYPASFPHEATLSTSNNKIHTAQDKLSESNNNADQALKFTKLALSYVGELAKGGIYPQDAPKTRFDYDGDGKADISVFRPSEGVWFINQSLAGFTSVPFGQTGDLIIPADYDGDGKTDVGVFRQGLWHLLLSQSGYTGISFGAAGDIPQPHDYDGDGWADLAVFRPSEGAWYLKRSLEGFSSIQFGTINDTPIAADYDGDGKADIAVFRAGVWHILRSNGGYTGVQFGAALDVPVSADFDGDLKSDLAVFRNGSWYLLRSQQGFTGVQFGFNTDKPVPADYDGDGRADIAVFRQGNWYILNSSNGSFRGEQFGTFNDKPTQYSY